MSTHDSKKTSDLSEQAMALAEQLGRAAGTIQGTAETWLNRQTLTEELTRVRDAAVEMLETLGAGAARARSAVRGKPAKRVSAAVTPAPPDPSRAPGKRHRTPAASKRGVKKSNATIPKMRVARAARQRRKSYA
jgi:hypothetical protein